MDVWYFSLYDKNASLMYDVELLNETGTSCGVARMY